jgi:beta-lactamase regulating signal transducer with metallopeptidase domain
LLIASGLANTNDYCETLLRVARQASSSQVHLACSMAGGLHPLANRLKRILDPEVQRAARLSLVNLAGIVVAAVVLLPGLRSPRKP